MNGAASRGSNRFSGALRLARVESLLGRLAPLLSERSFVVRRPSTGLLLLHLDPRFVDGRSFEANEVWRPKARKYRFQMMRPDGSLLWRLDNAPHHRDLAAFPHHLHRPARTAEAAAEWTLEGVLHHLDRSGDPSRWPALRPAED